MDETVTDGHGKRKKGQYGYRNYHRRLQLAKVLFGAAMILLQLAARNWADNDAAKNVLTLMAVLSVLPTANVAAPLLASWSLCTPGREFYDKVRKQERKGILLYDLIITSRDAIMPADAVLVHSVGVFVFCPSEKVDPKQAESYLNNTFSNHKLAPNVKVIQEFSSFLKRLEEIKPSEAYGDDGNVAYAASLLKNLSM